MKPESMKGHWSAEEDSILKQAIWLYGKNNWKKVNSI